jgi:uncharacterized membrane protein
VKTATSIGQTLRDEWHALAEVEQRALHALLTRAPTARNVNDLEAERLTPGNRLADAVTRQLGSWRFIIIQSLILVAWIALNLVAWIRQWDPYPFILLNLALSFQAAFSAPIIMMSQNREAAKDRLTAEHDYEVNLRAELEVAAIQARLDELAGRQWEALLDVQRQQLHLLGQIENLTREVHRVTTDVQRGNPAPPSVAS